MTESLKTPPTDAEIPNRGPRVTPAEVESEIVQANYFTAAEGIHGSNIAAGNALAQIPYTEHTLLTFCVLTLRNGFTVTGESAVASPENFDADIGKRIARENAVRNVWPLLGFRLRDRLCAEAHAAESPDPAPGSVI